MTSTPIVLKSFPFSRDGIRIVTAEEGPLPEDFPPDLVAGLAAAGFIGLPDGSNHAPVVAAPVVEPPATSGASEAPEPAIASETVVIANGPTGVTEPAPQPPVQTADLTDDERAALTDGSWEAWRFFKQRSVAAKISDKPVNNGDEAKAVIKAYIEASKL